MIENNDQTEAPNVPLRPSKELDFLKAEFGTVPIHLMSVFKTSLVNQDLARHYCRSVIRSGMYEEDLMEVKKMGEYFSPNETNGVVRTLMNHVQLANLNYAWNFSQSEKYKPHREIKKEKLSDFTQRFEVEYGVTSDNFSLPWLIFFRNLNCLGCSVPPGNNVDEQRQFAAKLVDIYERTRGYKPVFLGGIITNKNFNVLEVDVNGRREEVSWHGKLSIESIGVLEPFVDFGDNGTGKKINLLTSFTRSWDRDSQEDVNIFRKRWG